MLTATATVLSFFLGRCGFGEGGGWPGLSSGQQCDSLEKPEGLCNNGMFNPERNIPRVLLTITLDKLNHLAHKHKVCPLYLVRLRTACERMWAGTVQSPPKHLASGLQIFF